MREAALAAALAGHWCAGQDAGRLLKSLPDLERLADLDEQRAQLERRIDTMEEAIAAYQPLAAPLLDLLALPPGTALAELLPAARKCAGAAEQAVRAIEAETERRDRAEQAIREATIARTAAEAEIANVLAGQQVGDAGDAGETVDRLSAATTCDAASGRPRGLCGRRRRLRRRYAGRRGGGTRSGPHRHAARGRR